MTNDEKKFYPRRRGPKTGPHARQEHTLGPELDALIDQYVERREKLRLTQSEVAVQIHVSRELLNRMETKMVAPSVAVFVRYAKVLGLALVLQ